MSEAFRDQAAEIFFAENLCKDFEREFIISSEGKEEKSAKNRSETPRQAEDFALLRRALQRRFSAPFSPK